jgi:hypothetical protein
MDEAFLKQWMEKTNKRLDALEVLKAKPAPAPIPKVKSSSYPRWIYRREPVSGEVQAQLIKNEADMPADGAYSDSPANLEAAEEFKAVVEPSLDEIEPDMDLEIPHPGEPKEARKESSVPDVTGEVEFVSIPDDWAEMHHKSRVKLAKQLPGGEDVVTNDDAIALIELELENRGNSD